MPRKKAGIAGALPSETRRALSILMEGGLLVRTRSGDSVVLQCDHLVRADLVVTRNGLDLVFCRRDEDWFPVKRKAKMSDFGGGTERQEQLW